MTALSMPRSMRTTVATEVRPLLAGFLAIQFLIGYEWLMSGLSKINAGSFPQSLAGTLSDATNGQTGWYKSFIDGVVIPNGELFGYLVMVGELAVGVALVAAALIGLVRWGHLTSIQHVVLLGVIALSCVVGAFMSANFHLVMGANAPWTISPDPNDQGVDLDSLMVMLQLVVVVASVYLLRQRRAHAA
jgi:uncharacterized membrane protein YphA (DoxX/SURF4 family)